ncbi:MULTISPECIES: MFS transporter [unclassified Nonomuraea]|uniref:MFS transporter n=1 Tax=unclassified Nonomuraea TaxID=2593643 RepID=UPI003404D669
MRKSHIVLAALFVCVFVVGTAESLIAGLLPQVAADLDVTVGLAGQAVTAYALGVVIGGPVVTALTVRLPRKGLAQGLMLLFAAGSAICALAPSYEILIAGRVLSSLSHAAFLTLALLTAARVAPAERTGSAIAAVASGFAVATLAGVPVGVLLGQDAGWRFPFGALAVLAVAGAALLGLLLPRQAAEGARVRDELRVVARRPVPLIIVTTAVGFAGVATVFTYIAPLLTEVAGFSTAQMSGLLLAYGAGSLAGNAAAGRLTDRSLSGTVRGVLGGLAGVLAVVPFAVAWKPAAVVAVVALGLLSTATIAPLQGLLLRHASAAPALAVSFNVGAFNLGWVMGSMIGGAIVSAGALRWTGLAGALLSLAGLGLSYLALPRSATPARDAARTDRLPA